MGPTGRRQFLSATGALLCALLGAPLAYAQAQVVGVLALDPPAAAKIWDKFFGGGLRKLGYNVGQSLVIEYRWASGDIAQYPKLARELVAREPMVIVTHCGPSLRAIREVSRTLPVIALCVDEKNFLGEIASLSRPGGYTTGITLLSPESVGKRLELLREILPDLSRLAVLYEPHDPIDSHWRELKRLQPRFGLTLQPLPLLKGETLEASFEAAVRERAQALFVFPTNRLIAERVQIAELARRYRIATVFELEMHVLAGGLISYGASGAEFVGKTAPMYVDKILKGAKPGELPVVQPTQFKLFVNLTTARALGLTIPPSILLRADRVIE